MKITIEMENLNKIVEETVKNNTEETIQDYVAQKTKSILDESYRDIIDEQINSAIKQSIQTYLDCYQIQVGNPFNGEELRTFTPREYINHTISEIFEKKMFTKEVEDSWSGQKKVKTTTFEEYMKLHFDFASEIKKYMDSFAAGLRREVKNKLESEYNRATREALSDVVMDTIMENEKFKNISNSIKRLGE